MDSGGVVVGLFELNTDNQGQLETAFGLACGWEAVVPRFVMPASPG
jgi:hypothetical protein